MERKWVFVCGVYGWEEGGRVAWGWVVIWGGQRGTLSCDRGWDGVVLARGVVGHGAGNNKGRLANHQRVVVLCWWELLLSSAGVERTLCAGRVVWSGVGVVVGGIVCVREVLLR